MHTSFLLQRGSDTSVAYILVFFKDETHVILEVSWISLEKG